MSDSISVTISATTADLQAELALAQARLRDVSAEVKRLASAMQSDAATGSDALLGKLRNVTSDMAGMRQEVRDLQGQLREASAQAQLASGTLGTVGTAATETGGKINAGVTRELIVLGHEAMSGNFSRIPGSFMVLAERVEVAGGAMAAAVGGVALLGAALGHLVVAAMQAAQSMRELANAAVLQGRAAAQVVAQAKAIATQMTQTGQIGTSDAQKIANAIAGLGNVSDVTKQKLASVGLALNMAIGKGDAGKTADDLTRLFGNTGSLEAFTKQYDLLSESQLGAWKTAVQQKDAAAQQAIVADALVARLKTEQDHFVATNKAATDYNRQMAILGSVGEGAAAGAAMFNRNAPKPAAPMTTLEVPGTTASAEVRKQQEQGFSSWEQDQEQQLRDKLVAIGKSGSKAKLDDEKAKAEATVKFWNDAANQEGLSADNLRVAKEKADQATLRLQALDFQGASSWMQQEEVALQDKLLGIKGAGTKSSIELDRARYQTEVQFWNDAAKQAGISENQRLEAKSRANQAALRLQSIEVRGSAAASKTEVSEEVAALNAKQAAVKDDFAKWDTLQQQKLAVLQRAYGQQSVQYQNALREEETARRAANDRMIRDQEQVLEAKRRVSEQEIQQQKFWLDEEVADDNISKQRSLQILRAFSAMKHQIEQQSLLDLMSTLDQESEAYKKLFTTLQTLQQQWQTQDVKLHRQMMNDITQQWESAAQPIANAFSTAIGGIIQGTETVRGAVAKMAQSIVLSYIDMGIRSFVSWSANQLRMLVMTETSTAAQTAAIVAGGQSQVAATVAAKTEASAASAALGAPAVMADAARAAAGTYASVSEIPIVGWLLAPPAAAAAYAATAAYSGMASFDVGAWDLPGDMIARVHQGEMIVPASFAEGIRSSAAAGGGSSNTSNSTTNSQTSVSQPVSVSFNVNAVDAASVSAFFNAHAPSLARTVSRYLNNNPSVRPSY